MAARHTVHPSGSIVVLSHFCPWKDHLFELEETLKKADSAYSPVLYVLYGDSGGSWRIQVRLRLLFCCRHVLCVCDAHVCMFIRCVCVQAVPVTPTSFSSRRSLPASWCGLRDDALSTKVPCLRCVYVLLLLY